MADGVRSPSKLSSKEDKAQVITLSRNENRQHMMASAGERVAEGTRTPNTQIHSLVL